MNGVSFSQKRANFNIKIGNIEDKIDALIVKTDKFKYDMLIGLDVINKFNLKQDYNLIIRQRQHDNQEIVLDESTESDNLDCVNFNENIDVDQFNVKVDHLNERQKVKIEELIEEYSSCFAKHKFDVGQVKDNEAQIKLIEERYVSKKPYRCS